MMAWIKRVTMLMPERFTLFGKPIVRWKYLCATERAFHS